MTDVLRSSSITELSTLLLHRPTSLLTSLFSLMNIVHLYLSLFI